MIDAKWPKVDKFPSPDEIVEVLFLLVKDQEGADEFIKDGPAGYHHGFGTMVRNEFHLWHPENPFTMKDYVPELRNGVDYNPRHPDNTSGYIFRKLHERLAEYKKEHS